MTTDVTVTDEAVASLEGTADPRLRELLTGLIRHLHAFARETRLTQAEWERAIGFLTETGKMCTDTRQEFILLSDVLGLSMLVETINGDHAAGSTESTVLGPFHMTESPVRELGANIDLLGGGEPCLVSGRIVSGDGTALPGALLDVWQADGNGFYDVQQPDVQPRATAGGCSPPTPRAASGSAPASRARTPSRRTARSANSSKRRAVTPTAPPTSTSSPRPRATSRSPLTSS